MLGRQEDFALDRGDTGISIKAKEVIAKDSSDDT
jgi:hypothetical protein